MKTLTRLVLITGVGSALLAGCRAPRQATRQWEYKVITAHIYDELQPALTKAGGDGWEVVSAVNRDLHATVVLKRPKQ